MEKAKLFVTKGVAIAVTIFILTIIASIFSSLNSNKPLTVFGVKPLTVLSNSMAPAFEAGDVIFIREVNAGDLRKGDIISFYNQDKNLITHRITSIVEISGEKHFSTKGDNNNALDEDVTPGSEIVGKKVFHIPYLGFLSKFTKGPIGFLLFIVLPLTGYICITVYERLKPKEKQGEFTK